MTLFQLKLVAGGGVAALLLGGGVMWAMTDPPAPRCNDEVAQKSLKDWAKDNYEANAIFELMFPNVAYHRRFELSPDDLGLLKADMRDDTKREIYAIEEGPEVVWSGWQKTASVSSLSEGSDARANLLRASELWATITFRRTS